MRVCCRLTGLDAPRWWRDARRARGEPGLQSSVRSVSRSVCHVLSSAVMYLYREAPSKISSTLVARSAFWARVGPAACDQHSFIGGSRGAPTEARRWAGREILSLSCGMPACLPACLLAYLPAYLSDLTIMNGHGAHRRQEGSQLAAEPACSRRVRAPSETWGEGCSWQVGEATTRRVKWAWVAGLSGPVMASLWVDAPTPRVHPPCGSSTRSSRQARDRLTGR